MAVIDPDIQMFDRVLIKTLVADNARLRALNVEMLAALSRLFDAASGFNVSGVYFAEFEKEALSAAGAIIDRFATMTDRRHKVTAEQADAEATR